MTYYLKHCQRDVEYFPWGTVSRRVIPSSPVIMRQELPKICLFLIAFIKYVWTLHAEKKKSFIDQNDLQNVSLVLENTFCCCAWKFFLATRGISFGNESSFPQGWLESFKNNLRLFWSGYRCLKPNVVDTSYVGYYINWKTVSFNLPKAVYLFHFLGFRGANCHRKSYRINNRAASEQTFHLNNVKRCWEFHYILRGISMGKTL